MKLLISFVNSSISLGGFDWETGELFWSLPSRRTSACGICYHNEELLIASDDTVRQLSARREQVIRLPGPHASLAHSVHSVDEETFGVADTGHSLVRLYANDGRHLRDVSPIRAWSSTPPDALHLNDFAVTPQGIIASSFDGRPWRIVRDQVPDWSSLRAPGVGLLWNLSELSEVGRVVACGLNHPHSLVYRAPDLAHCSSSTGSLHLWRFSDQGTLTERCANNVSNEHFLRGALPLEDGWMLGGSSPRHAEPPNNHMALYRLTEPDGTVESKRLPLCGEIYDILPWNEDLLRPVISGPLCHE